MKDNQHHKHKDSQEDTYHFYFKKNKSLTPSIGNLTTKASQKKPYEHISYTGHMDLPFDEGVFLESLNL